MVKSIGRLFLCISMVVALSVSVCPGQSVAEERHQLSWIGNSFPGSFYHRGRFARAVPQDVKEGYVTPDGTLVTVTWYDEGHQRVNLFRDGGLIGVPKNTHGPVALAVTADDNAVYVGCVRGRGDDRTNFIRVYDRSDPLMEKTFADIVVGQTKGYQPNLGITLRDGKLYVSDQASNSIIVFDTDTRERVFSFPVERPRKLAVDSTGRVWVIQSGRGANNVGPGVGALVLGFNAEGEQIADLGEDVVVPTAIAVCHATDRLMVADSEPGRNHIRIYDTTGETPALADTFGRCITSGVPGRWEADKFDHLTAIGTDREGNTYVAWNGGPPHTIGGGRVESNAQGLTIVSLAPDASERWALHGRHFVDMAAPDPGDENSVFASNERYGMDYTRPAGREWSFAAYTLDRLRYPQDPRLWQSHAYTSQMLRLEGRPFMILQDQYRDANVMYRFDGEIAVPAVFFGGKFPWIVRGNILPPNRPDDMRKFMWRDGSGSTPPDGAFQTDEYHPLNAFIWGSVTWSANGDVWNVPVHGDRIIHYPFLGLDENGIPIYSEEKARVIANPGDLELIRKVEYDSENDVMFMIGFADRAQDRDHGRNMGRSIGRQVVRYDNWSTEPTVRSVMKLPDVVHKSMTYVGDWVFVGQRLGMEVRVFDSRTGEQIHHWKPGREVGGHLWTGMGLDIERGLRAFQRANGEILVFSEEVSYAKVLMHRWMPPADQAME